MYPSPSMSWPRRMTAHGTPGAAALKSTVFCRLCMAALLLIHSGRGDTYAPGPSVIVAVLLLAAPLAYGQDTQEVKDLSGAPPPARVAVPRNQSRPPAARRLLIGPAPQRAPQRGRHRLPRRLRPHLRRRCSCRSIRCCADDEAQRRAVPAAAGREATTPLPALRCRATHGVRPRPSGAAYTGTAGVPVSARGYTLQQLLRLPA